MNLRPSSSRVARTSSARPSATAERRGGSRSDALVRAACVALVCLAVGGCRTVRRDADASAVTSIVREQESAWNRGDIRGFMSAGYWDSSELTFFSGGDVTQGFEPVLARYVKRYQSEGAEMGRLSFTDVEVLPWSDDLVIARGRWALDFEKQTDVAGLFTLVFRRLATGWRIVHDHTSVAK